MNYKLLVFSLIIIITVNANAQKGRRYPVEWQKFRAAESGCEAIKLTTDTSDDCRLYFYNNPFVKDMNSIVFASKRTGYWNLFLISLQDGVITQLTDGKKVQARGAAVSATKEEVYFVSGKQILSCNLHNYQEKVLYSFPDSFQVSASLGINTEGSMLAMAITKKVNVVVSKIKHFDNAGEKYLLHPESRIIVIATDGSMSKTVRIENNWLSHVTFNPIESNILLYCQEGPWQMVEQRMWICNINDTSVHYPVRKEEVPAIKIGHEYWFPDGKHVGYQVSSSSIKKGIGIADYSTGKYTEYDGADDSHTEIDLSGKYFVGDGRNNNRILSLYHLDNNKLVKEILVNHKGGFDQDYIHPHPSFIDDKGRLLYTSNADGNCNIYLMYCRDAMLGDSNKK